MSELTQGTAPAENVAAPTADAPAPVEVPQEQGASQTPPATPPPSKWAGRTPEEMARLLDDQERMIGRQTAEVSEARQRMAGYEQQFSQLLMSQAQQAQTAPQHTPAPDEPERFDWEKPEQAVDRRVERKLRSEMDGLRRQMMMETAASQAPIAKNMAKTMYPDAFRGVADEELDRAMYGGAAAGNVQPQNLTKPEAWRMLGWILQGEKSGYKLPVPGVTPVSPTATETPMGAKPQSFNNDEAVVIDDAARKMIKGIGMTEDEYMKNRRAERGGR